MGNEGSSLVDHEDDDGRKRSSSSKKKRRDKMGTDASAKAREIGESISASFRNSSHHSDKDSPAAVLIDSMCASVANVLDGDSKNRRSRRGRNLSAYSEDDASLSEEDSRLLSDDDETFDSYHHKKKKSTSAVTKTNSSAVSDTDNSSYISNDYTETSHEDRGKKNNDESTLGYPSEDDESTLPEVRKSRRKGRNHDDHSDIPSPSDVPPLLSKPLASSFAKRCYFTKAGIGKTAQHYEGLTLTGNTVLMLSAAMKLKGCPTICDEDLRRVEQTYPNQFSRLPDELLLSSGWRRISKYCHFSNKPIPDGVPFFHSKQRIHPQGGYYFLLAAAVGMIRPIDVEPLTMDTLIVLETDYPSQCDTAPEGLISDPSMWILVDKFCFFSGGPINTEEDVYYRADFDGNEIYMLAFLSPSLTPEELYRLGPDGEVQNDLGLKSVAAVEEVESVYDLTDRDFDDLKLYHLGPCRALPPYILQPNSWTKVLPPHFINARQKALDCAIEYEAVHGVSQPPIPLSYHHQQPQQMNNEGVVPGNGPPPMMQHPEQHPSHMMDPIGQPIPQTNVMPSNNADYTATNDPNSTSGYVEFGQGQTTNNDVSMASSAPIYWQQQGGQAPQPPQQQSAVDWNHHQQQQEYYSQQQEYPSQQFAPVQHNPADQLPPQTSIPIEQQARQQQGPNGYSYYDPEVATIGEGNGVGGLGGENLAPPGPIPMRMNMAESEAMSEPAADLVRQELQREVEEEGAFVSPIESGQPIDEAIATRALQQVNHSIEESQQQQETQPPPEKPTEEGNLPPISSPQKEAPSPEEEKAKVELNMRSSRLDPPVDDDSRPLGEKKINPSPPSPDAPEDEGSGRTDGDERSDVKTPLSPGGIVLSQHSSYTKQPQAPQPKEEEENMADQGDFTEDNIFPTGNDLNDVADQNSTASPDIAHTEKDSPAKRKRRDKIIISTMDQDTTPSKNTSQQKDQLEEDQLSVDSSRCVNERTGNDGGGAQMESPLAETTPDNGSVRSNPYHARQERAVSSLRIETNHDSISQRDDLDYPMENEPFTPSPRTRSFDGASYDDDNRYGNVNHQHHEESFDSYTDYGQPLNAVHYDQRKDDVNDSGYLTSPSQFRSPESANVGRADRDYYDDNYYNDSPRNHAGASGLSPAGFSDDYDSFGPSNDGAHYPYSKTEQEQGRKWDSSPYASNLSSSSPRNIGSSHTPSGRPGSPSGFTDVSERSGYSASSAMRGAQELLKKNRRKRLALRASDQKQQEQHQHIPASSPDFSMKSGSFAHRETFSPDTKEGESDYDTATEVTSVVSGSSVWTSATNPDQSSRRAFILRMAKARMKGGNNTPSSAEGEGGSPEKASASISESEKKFEESLEKTRKSFESLHSEDSQEV